MLSGCGGGSDNSSKGVSKTSNTDTQKPVFVSPSTVKVRENQKEVLTVKAEDDSEVFYSLSGIDKDSFMLDENTGKITFKTAPDYETKNSYTITVNATDIARNVSSQKLEIIIEDIVEIKSVSNSKLLKTGQTKSYTLYDDGYYQKGISRNYTRGSDIVIDHITGLQWQDDIAVSSIDMSWNDAKQYCTKLNLGGYNDWRLPSIEELESIIDYSRRADKSRGILGAINPIFKYINSNNGFGLVYWSSSSDVSYLLDAWTVGFNYGDDSSYPKHLFNGVRCVR